MDPKRATELLQAQRSRIEHALAELDPGPSDELSHLDQHGRTRAPSCSTRSATPASREQLRDQLAAVERAEERLMLGTYGLSVDSGEPIPDDRLEAIPWAERTVEEQSRYDQGG